MGLCPKIPVNIGGNRSEPAMSEPIPTRDAAADINAACKKHAKTEIKPI